MGSPGVRSWNWLSSPGLQDIHQHKASAGEHHAGSERGVSSTTQARSVLSGSLILNHVHSFAGWRSADIKIHKFARLKSSHLNQDSWKDMGMEMVVWHVGSEECSRTVLHPGVVCVVPGAILLLREQKIKTVGVLSFSKGTVRPQQALKLIANNWFTVVWEADSSPERF